jgi:hypothetical protein
LLDNGYYEEDEEEDSNGIFNPAIDQILWRRPSQQLPFPAQDYFVKYKNYSYRHCDWLTENEIVDSDKTGKNKLGRFNKQFEERILEKVFSLHDLGNRPGKPRSRVFRSNIHQSGQDLVGG